MIRTRFPTDGEQPLAFLNLDCVVVVDMFVAEKGVFVFIFIIQFHCLSSGSLESLIGVTAVVAILVLHHPGLRAH